MIIIIKYICVWLIYYNIIYYNNIINMSLKYLRLGLTESTLLSFYWIELHHKLIDKQLSESKENLIKWLYTTSGYYDKTQIGNYMNVMHKNDDPIVYKKYMNLLLNFLHKADILNIHFHGWNSPNNYLRNKFTDFLESKTQHPINKDIIYNFIKDKKVLIISPFSPLMKQQYDSGNLKKIYQDTPNVESILTYKYPYTFFNNGPHNNILETCDHEFNQILNIYDINSYDNVIISCGAYSNLLAEKFYNLNKNVCTVGGDLQGFFGIANKRTKDWNKNNFINSEYWILDIPEEYKPDDYMKIENGCYW